MNETQHIEHYLLGTLAPADKLLMDAQLLLTTNLREKAEWQQHTYALVKAYSRKELKKEIATVQQKLFTETRFQSFRNKIAQIFT